MTLYFVVGCEDIGGVMSVKMQDMTCPKCGATMNFNEEKSKAECAYCGYRMLVEQKESISQLRERMRSQSYEYHKGKLEAQEEAGRRRRLRKLRNTASFVGAFVVVIVLANFGKTMAKPQVNPFSLIQISFQGTDGQGEVAMEFVPGEVDRNLIDYEISKSRGLFQGETITIKATSEDYRLTQSQRSYVVEGLDEYLKELTDIPADALELIHAKAENVLELNLDSSKKVGYFVDMQPVKLFLTTDGKQKNELYDVFEVRFNGNGEESVYYVLACFDDVLIRKGEQVSMSMSYGIYYGNLTQVSGSIWIMAFDSVEDIRTDILTSQESYMELKELDL